jgi:hydroxyacylglutathione hydrolase
MRRTAGIAVLGLSACGYPLTQFAVRRGGMRGAALAELVCGGLAIRDASMVASGCTDRLGKVPAALLRLETAVGVVASLAGLHPLLLARPGRRMASPGVRAADNIRRAAVATLFGLHTVRFAIYLSPSQGLRTPPAPDAPAPPRREPETAGVRPIEFPMRMAGIRLGTVNCYLVRAGTGYVLVDTGFASNRAGLERELEDAGCRPGELKLIVLTHGDLDHTGNGAYLRRKYHAKIAMHRDEFGVTEQGDNTLSRGTMTLPRRVISEITVKVLSLLLRPGKFERFRPDVAVDDGYDLSGYGLDAKVLHLPGHSSGSIGILTADGDLFCGRSAVEYARAGYSPDCRRPGGAEGQRGKTEQPGSQHGVPRPREAVPHGVIQAGRPGSYAQAPAPPGLINIPRRVSDGGAAAFGSMCVRAPAPGSARPKR